MRMACALTRVEVDIGVELAADKVVVGAGDALQLNRNIDEGVAALNLEHLLRNLPDDLGPRVEVLVHPTRPPAAPALSTSSCSTATSSPLGPTPGFPLYFTCTGNGDRQMVSALLVYANLCEPGVVGKFQKAVVWRLVWKIVVGRLC